MPSLSRLFPIRLMILAFSASLVAHATVPRWASAQHGAAESKPGKGPAFVAPPESDPNFELMGEFVGQIKADGDQEKQTLALQIRPIANNQFHAMAFYGGLPGQGKHQPEEMRLIGLRAADTLVLSGGPWAVFVTGKGCNLVSSSGKLLGRLKRVERISPTLGAKPPKDAIVLFDGSDVQQFVDASMTDSGLLEQGAMISPMFQDFNLHVEFRLPYMPQADGQQRGNSGLYLQSRYECQILDSFGTERMFNGLGALYRIKAPDVNMALPPLRWQTYDVHFTAPRWASDGTKVRNAHITSWVNGVKVQDNVSLASKTGAGQQEAPTLLPIKLQDHGDPVRFRNIWIVDRGLSGGEFPVVASKKQRAEAAKHEWELSEEPAASDESEAKADPEDKPSESQEASDGDAEKTEAADSDGEKAEQPSASEQAPADEGGQADSAE